MGTQEYLLDKAEKKGIQTGIQKGKIAGKIEILKDLGYSITEIAKKLTLSETEVKGFLKGAL